MTIEAFARHRPWLDGAVDAIRRRTAWSPFVESPSARLHPPGAREAGEARFHARLGRDYSLDQPTARWVGEEVSPYTGEALGIRYPQPDVDDLFESVRRAAPGLARATPEARVGLGLECLARWAEDAFENAFSTMHTAGQGFMLAFAGSGASSLDRGLEALALAWRAMDEVPSRAEYSRAFGRGPAVTLDKRYRLHPRGVAVVFACGTYPAWNAYPAILANLATGNPVIVKPHPGCILPMARTVELGRAVLAEAGLDPNLLTLAPDTRAEPIGGALVAHPDTRIVDFTGGAAWGRWLETSLPREVQVYTETAGTNAVVLDSAEDLDAVLDAVAHGVCLFSSQMCTAPQNVFVAAEGVRTPERLVPFGEVEARLVAAIERHVGEPEQAAPLTGALMSPATLEDLARLEAEARGVGRVLLAPRRFATAEHPQARMSTPLLVGVDAEPRAIYGREHFGPMAFLIRCEDRDHALRRATEDARQHGAIASYAYSSDPDRQAAIVEAFGDAGASVGVNLLRQRPINFTAAFSDYHVTGLNPAGTACLTDLAFVASRFRITQSKIERPA